jgi:hypothetical protein
MKGCFFDAENQVSGFKRRVHLRACLRDVDVLGDKLWATNIDTAYSTHVDILLQRKHPALTLLYEHTYIITAH